MVATTSRSAIQGSGPSGSGPSAAVATAQHYPHTLRHCGPLAPPVVAAPPTGARPGGVRPRDAAGGPGRATADRRRLAARHSSCISQWCRQKTIPTPPSVLTASAGSHSALSLATTTTTERLRRRRAVLGVVLAGARWVITGSSGGDSGLPPNLAPRRSRRRSTGSPRDTTQSW